MSAPSQATVPALGGNRPARIFASVVLPEPLSPTSATTWPRGSSIDTSRRLGTWRLGYVNETLSTVIRSKPAGTGSVPWRDTTEGSSPTNEVKSRMNRELS
jgi:hypothetical protein